MLGPYPEWMVNEHPISKMYFAPEGFLYEIDPTSMHPGVYMLRPASNSSLREVLDRFVHPDVFGDVAAFSNFLSTLLTIDSRERPSAAAAIQDPWLDTVRPLEASPAPDN